MKIAKILLSEPTLPSYKSGSWTQRIEYFLAQESPTFDYVICGEAKEKSTNAKIIPTALVTNRFLLKIFPALKFKNFIEALNNIITQYDKVIICIIDNIKLQNAVNLYIDKSNLKDKISVIFYNCGFSYFLEQHKHNQFTKHIDEIVFLTNAAYLHNKNYYCDFVPEVSVIHNPIDKKIFFPIAPQVKQQLLEEQQLSGKTVYLWLSHDRPKKGLSLILNAWKSFSNQNPNVELLIVGATRIEKIKNVLFLGIVPNNEVAKYYQLAHVFLFPTLWKEGFGLSLSQAICSGCYCIAANNGGVAEFFTANDGVMINEPNKGEHWVTEMEIAYHKINEGWQNEKAGNQISTFEEWSQQFAAIFQKWENRLNQ